MTEAEMERAIYETMIDGYFATPALELHFRIKAQLATTRIQAQMRAERVSSERARREHIRELAKLPLRERLRTGVLVEGVG